MAARAAPPAPNGDLQQTSHADWSEGLPRTMSINSITLE
jgi:hypothetical protein